MVLQQTWEKEGMILHPQILATDYAGEIGEEAFKAILLHYTDCTEKDIKHLEGKDYLMRKHFGTGFFRMQKDK
mgnify:CR=1 FL=1